MLSPMLVSLDGISGVFLPCWFAQDKKIMASNNRHFFTAQQNKGAPSLLDDAPCGSNAIYQRPGILIPPPPPGRLGTLGTLGALGA
jgi:hypothetical protein